MRLDSTPDEFYHKKIAFGLLTPTWEYLSEAEQEAVVNGRYRGDGRHLDSFVTADPLLLSLEDPTRERT